MGGSFVNSIRWVYGSIIRPDIHFPKATGVDDVECVYRGFFFFLVSKMTMTMKQTTKHTVSKRGHW